MAAVSGENSVNRRQDGEISLCRNVLDASIVTGAALSLAYQVGLVLRLPAWSFYPLSLIFLAAGGCFLIQRWRKKSGQRGSFRAELVWLAPGAVLFVLSFFYFRISYDDMWYYHNAVLQISGHLNEPFFRVPMAFHDERLSESLIGVLPAYKQIPALLAKPLGFDPVYFYRNIVGAVILFVFATTYMEWFRQLGFPFRLVLAGFFAVLLFLLLDANTRQSFGVYSIGLFWLGRCILIGTLIPLLWIYAMDLVNQPNRGNALLLLLVTIAAIGASSSAMFLVPSLLLGILVTQLAIGKFGKQQRKAALFIIGALGFWALVVGLYLVSARGNVSVSSTLDGLMSRMYGESYFSNLANVFDNYLKLSAYLFATVLLPWFILRREQAAIIAGVSLGIFLVIMNPLTGPILQDVVSRLAFSRFFYLLPVPLCFGLAVIAVIRWKVSKWGAVLGVLVILLNLFGFEQSLFQPHAKYRYDYSVFKAPWEPRYFPEEYAAVEELREEMKGRYILAPKHFMMVAGLLYPENKYESTRDLMTTIAYRASGLEEEGESRGAAQNFVQAGKFQNRETESGFRESIERGVNLIVVEHECVAGVEEVLKSVGKLYSKKSVAGIYSRYLIKEPGI